MDVVRGRHWPPEARLDLGSGYLSHCYAPGVRRAGHERGARGQRNGCGRSAWRRRGRKSGRRMELTPAPGSRPGSAARGSP